MSGPISDSLREKAKDFRELADELEGLAAEMLADDNVPNDLVAADLMEQAADYDFMAGVMDSLADFVDWIGDDLE